MAARSAARAPVMLRRSAGLICRAKAAALRATCVPTAESFSLFGGGHGWAGWRRIQAARREDPQGDAALTLRRLHGAACCFLRVSRYESVGAHLGPRIKMRRAGAAEEVAARVFARSPRRLWMSLPISLK